MTISSAVDYKMNRTTKPCHVDVGFRTTPVCVLFITPRNWVRSSPPRLEYGFRNWTGLEIAPKVKQPLLQIACGMIIFRLLFLSDTVNLTMLFCLPFSDQR